MIATLLPDPLWDLIEPFLPILSEDLRPARSVLPGAAISWEIRRFLAREKLTGECSSTK
jgi:hypothetical protein